MMISRKLIHVLDDDISVLGAVERLLKARGFDVETFRTIDSFIERANLRAATCLVLDINLNGASGIELKRKLNAAGISPPVIFITARDEDVTRRAARRLRGVSFKAVFVEGPGRRDRGVARRPIVRASRHYPCGQCA